MLHTEWVFLRKNLRASQKAVCADRKLELVFLTLVRTFEAIAIAVGRDNFELCASITKRTSHEQKGNKRRHTVRLGAFSLHSVLNRRSVLRVH